MSKNRSRWDCFIIEDKIDREPGKLRLYRAQIKWTVSRGRNTYGYNICSLYVNGDKVTSCNGGGYDMIGTVLADYICKAYQGRFKALTVEDWDYVHPYADKKGIISFDGAVGVNSVEMIANKIGVYFS